MPTPSDARLAQQLNEILLEVRRLFGMHGRTSWEIERVGPEAVTVRVYTWPRGTPVAHTAVAVRNAMLSFLRDTVPCARFRAVFRRPDRRRAYRRVELAFHRPGVRALPTPLIVIEANVAPCRAHWRALLARAAGSTQDFTGPRGGETP